MITGSVVRSAAVSPVVHEDSEDGGARGTVSAPRPAPLDGEDGGADDGCDGGMDETAGTLAAASGMPSETTVGGPGSGPGAAGSGGSCTTSIFPVSKGSFIARAESSVRRLRARRELPTDGAMTSGRLLEGKVAIITGAGNGIGRAHALLFAKEGASVVVNDVGGARDGTGSDARAADAVVDELVQAGFKAVANHDSVATAEGANGIVKCGVDAFGRVDILVNNAGILRDKTFLKMDEPMWDLVMAVHLRGTFLCSQAFVKQVVAQSGAEAGRSARIVNTTSVSGMMGNFGQANYAAAKAGIYGLTRTMSIELQKHRITVNALAPIAKTRLTEDLPMFQGVETMTPEHISPAALFLASDLCGDRTGHVLAVAGARLYAFKVIETPGKFKDDADGVWTPQEIAEHWGAIVKA